MIIIITIIIFIIFFINNITLTIVSFIIITTFSLLHHHHHHQRQCVCVCVYECIYKHIFEVITSSARFYSRGLISPALHLTLVKGKYLLSHRNWIAARQCPHPKISFNASEPFRSLTPQSHLSHSPWFLFC